MLRMPVKLIIFLLTLGSPRCLGHPTSLEQQARKLIREGKYQQAIPISERHLCGVLPGDESAAKVVDTMARTGAPVLCNES